LNAKAGQPKRKSDHETAYKAAQAKKGFPDDTKIWPDINVKLPDYPPDPTKCDETFEKYWQAYQNEIYEKFRNHVKEQLNMLKRKMEEDYKDPGLLLCARDDAATKEAQKQYTDAVVGIELPPNWDTGSHFLRRWERVDTS